MKLSFPAPQARLRVTLFRPVPVIGLGILAGLTALRTFNLLLLPMFYDEALHISRAQSILDKHTLLIDTNGGKFLQVWLIALVLPLTSDPLLAARALSAMIGLLAGIGSYLLARHLYGRNDVALVAAALYALAPHTLFHDRMALADSLLSALGIWSLLFSLVAMRQGRWWQILALGMCLGAAVAAKLSGIIFAVFPLLAAWLWRGDLPRRRMGLAVLAAWLLLIPWLLPVGLDIAWQYESTVRAHSWVEAQMTGSAYLVLLSQNLGTIIVALWTYLTPPLLLLALAEAGLSLRRRDRPARLLALAAMITPVFFLLTANDKFYPRYLLPAFPLLLILAAHGLVALADWLWNHKPWPIQRFRWGLLAGLFLLANLPAMNFDYLLLTDPLRAFWMPIDRWQYIGGPSAGYGVIDTVAYLRQQVFEKGAVIVVKRATDRIGAGDWTHYLNQPGISLEPVDFGHIPPPSFVQKLRSSRAAVFVVLDRPHEDEYVFPFTEGIYASNSTLVATFSRPGGESRIEVYQVKP